MSEEYKKLFEPCYMEYEGIDKPVHYTEEFLKELASKVNKTTLVFEEHNTESIGDVSNFKVIDGGLFGIVNSNKSTDNLAYSPYINCTLEDVGDCWLAINPTGFTDIALTSNPRKTVSLPNTNGGSRMEDKSDNETIKILNNQVKDLNKQLAVAENKNKANEEKLKKYDEMEKELSELKEWKETNSQLIEEQKPIIEAYNKHLETRKEELLNKISDGNEEVKAQLKDETLETLEKFDKLYAHEQPPQGIGSNNAQGLGQGDGSEDDEKAKREKEQEEVRAMFSELNVKEE